MAQCSLCGSAQEKEGMGFCHPCTTTLELLAAGGGRSFVPALGQRVYFAWPYTSAARQLILAIKSRGSERAAVALWQWLTEQAASGKNRRDSLWPALSAGRFGGVMPCPSSLWGRLRGKLDVAGWLAHHIAKRYDLPLLTPPFALRFRQRKRAQLGKKSQQEYGASVPLISSRSSHRNALDFERGNEVKPILLVDDVLTTGQTMAEVSAHLPAANYFVLALA